MGSEAGRLAVVEEASFIVVVAVEYVIEIVDVDILSGVGRCFFLSEVLRARCVGSRFFQLLLAGGLVSNVVLLWFKYFAAVIPAAGCG